MIFQNIASTPLPPFNMKLFSFPESVETLPSVFSWNNPTAICELGPGDQVTADTGLALAIENTHGFLLFLKRIGPHRNSPGQCWDPSISHPTKNFQGLQSLEAAWEGCEGFMKPEWTPADLAYGVTIEADPISNSICLMDANSE